MIFDLSANSGEPYKVPVLNNDYPANTTVNVGENVTLQVVIAAQGNPAAYTYQWYENGSAISGATEDTYSFTPAAIGDTTFYCAVTNEAGSVYSRTATVTCDKLMLYDYGDPCTSVTGGWTGLSIQSDGGGQWGYGGIMYTNGKVPISQYSKLVILYKWIDSGGSSGASVAITVNSGQKTSGTKYASFDFNKTTGTLHTATINIASLTADAYIRGASYYGTGRIYQVYMQ